MVLVFFYRVVNKSKKTTHIFYVRYIKKTWVIWAKLKFLHKIQRILKKSHNEVQCAFRKEVFDITSSPKSQQTWKLFAFAMLHQNTRRLPKQKSW